MSPVLALSTHGHHADRWTLSGKSEVLVPTTGPGKKRGTVPGMKTTQGIPAFFFGEHCAQPDFRQRPLVD